MMTILTHPGSAHKDDFLSAAVLLSVLDHAEVQRREPTRADLDDPDTYVVDVGMEYDPQRHNFDHHQDPALPCAFHLIMQHLGYHEAATLAFVWYPHMSMIDVNGPYRTAEHLGVESGVLFATASPIEGYLLSIFAGVDSLGRRDLLYRFMQNLGADMLALIDRKMQRLALLKTRARVLPVKQFRAVFSDIPTSPKLAMELYLRYLDDPLIIMSITPSNRGAGWELLRLGDNPRVDFRAIGTSPQVSFVHGSGFLAKTRTRLTLPEVIRLASQAIAD
jgi:hypothetical protein